MDNIEFLAKLQQHDACEEAIEWVGSQSLEEIWETCTRGDWLMWLVIFFHMDKKSNVVYLYADFIKKVLCYSTEPIANLLTTVNSIENSVETATHEDLDKYMVNLYEIYTTALSTIPEDDKEAMFDDVATLVKQRVPIPSYTELTQY